MSIPERMEKVIAAGADQFGGEAIPELLVNLVIKGNITIQRIDESARRILREKFHLGLFDNPYVDESAADEELVADRLGVARGVAERRREER